MRIVLDTNVLVSALLKQKSPPAQVLYSILASKIHIALDGRILAEYSRVLARPRFNFQTQQIDALLGFIAQSAHWVESARVDFPEDQILDIYDVPFAEVAIHGQAGALVTGNIKHFTFLKNWPIKVLLPQKFIEENPTLF